MQSLPQHAARVTRRAGAQRGTAHTGRAPPPPPPSSLCRWHGRDVAGRMRRRARTAWVASYLDYHNHI
eukprot:scaffold1439_cov404-Prasinococcus_capsulatus_cf.AAC.35